MPPPKPTPTQVAMVMLRAMPPVQAGALAAHTVPGQTAITLVTLHQVMKRTWKVWRLRIHEDYKFFNHLK